MPLLVLLLALALPHPAPADWRWPVEPAQVLRPFDPPEHPWLPGHRGVDMAAEPGQEVYAAGPGRVLFAGAVAGTPVVSVSHGTLRTTYLPVESALARGDPVAAGEPLGTLAADPLHCRGRPCLHWGLLRGTEYLDPLALLGRGRVRLLPLGPAAHPPPPSPTPGADGVPPPAEPLPTAAAGPVGAAAPSSGGTRSGRACACVRRGGGPGGRCRAGAPPTRACRPACCAGWRGPGTPARCAGRRPR